MKIDFLISIIRRDTLVTSEMLSGIEMLMQLYRDFESLAMELEKYDVAYYIESNSIVSDAEYDDLKRELQLKIDDITQKISTLKQLQIVSIQNLCKAINKHIRDQQKKVGAKPSRKFTKVKHLRPMLSLSNCFSEDDVKQFLNRVDGSEVEIVCELKIDGVSFSVIYENGILVRGVTRGNGETGEDITLNVKEIVSLPHKIDYLGLLELRGEIYMDKETFARFSEFSNPRNAASGSIRQLNPKITRERNLKYFVWDCNVSGIDSHYKGLIFAKKLGFTINNYIKITHSFSEMMNFYEEISRIRCDLNYEIDGIVYKINSIERQEELGNTGHSPRWATAHKFPAAQTSTIIIDIIIQIGKSGVLTPVAILQPVEINGAVISRVTLHNARELHRNDYRIGDTVKIIRSGDVIPKINGVIKHSENSQRFEMPNKCPICNSQVIDDGNFVHKVCTGNWSCEAQLIERLKHFVSRDAFNIIGLGEKQIEYLVHEKLIQNYANIFELQHLNQSLEIPLQMRHGWGDKSTFELFKAIENARKIELYRLIYSLSIPLVGIEVAQLIAGYFKTYDELLRVVTNTENLNILQNIHGIGEQIAKSMIDFFTNTYNLELIFNLLQYTEIIPISEQLITDNAKTFAFTGGLVSITRDEAAQLVRDHGSIFASSITKNTDYLVIGEKPSSSKINKAKSFKIDILTEDDFMKLIHNQLKAV